MTTTSTTASTASTASPILRRPNGRPQACEPCRKRKVACDHAHPICNRCRKRRQTAECVYLISATTSRAPASTTPVRLTTHPHSHPHPHPHPHPHQLPLPLPPPPSYPVSPTPGSRSRTGSGSGSEPAPARRAGLGGRSITSSPDTTATATTITTTSANTPTTRPTDPRSPEGLGPRQASPGYLGFTSYSAVYEETQISLSRLQGASSSSATTPVDSDGTQPISAAPAAAGGGGTGGVTAATTTAAVSGSNSSSNSSNSSTINKNAFALNPRTRDECLFVLRQVPEASRGKVCLRGSPCEAWIFHSLDRVLESFYDTFGHYFAPERPRTDEALEELAALLSQNTTLPFSDDDDIAPDDWLAQLSGPRARWETLGLLFGFWDFSVSSVSIVKSCAQDEFGRPSQVTKRCLDHCVDMCQELSPANSMLLFLSYRRLVLDTVLNGDMNRRAWFMLGEVIALLTYLGYHVLPDAADYQAKFMVEIKRKMYYKVYILHGSLVSLTGRPPLMSHRFSTTPLPLDLANSTLYSNDRERIRRAMEATDRGGWYVGPGLLAVTPVRARAKLALLREEIMAYALCTKRHESVEALLDFKARELQIVAEFPLSVQYQDSDLEQHPSPDSSVGRIYWRLLLRLEHLLNLFFIERLLVKHAGYPQTELLSVSYDMVTHTLPFWTHQDTLLPLRGDCEWLVMAFGVPAGGILCQELLRPTTTITTTAAPLPRPVVTRSGLIQKLSLLVGFLDWIRPNAPNGDLCSACKIVIQRVLDQALNAPSAPAGGYESVGGGGEGAESAGGGNGGAVDGLGGLGLGLGLDWDFTTQVDFDFDLLDTFGWTRPEPSSQMQTS
ncbi:hypothetical protein F5Y17DRAFT_111397 [Xylariaceae sp. FL0594]|nr:hypothetical protein F5Y17DRAFT_111397 [Xylariaceae sp. FL0594]